MLTIEPIARLTTQLSRLPGIGQKTAQRLAYHILDMPVSQAQELAAAIVAAREKVKDCPVCGTYTDVVPCPICTDDARDGSVSALSATQRTFWPWSARASSAAGTTCCTACFRRGRYGPNDIRINELIERVKLGGVKEVILATNPDVEGEATASYIARCLSPWALPARALRTASPSAATSSTQTRLRWQSHGRPRPY
jgi:recombination protein RecR